MTMDSQFYAAPLQVHDGTWDVFAADWRAQCEELGEQAEDYAPDITAILRGVAAGETEQTSLSKTSVWGIYEGDDEYRRYWAVCLLNWVYQLPGTTAPTVRVRHLVVSPRLDFGAEEVGKYAHVLIGALNGVLTVTADFYEARQIHFHLRSPADVNFFAAIGNALSRSPHFERVEKRGAWLYITIAEEGDDHDSLTEG